MDDANRSAPRARLALAVIALLSPGCRKGDQPGAAPAAPAGAGLHCPQDLSGDWFNATDRRFSYRLKDLGDRVEGRFIARAADGGVVAPEAGDEPMTLEFHRSQTALAGLLRSFDQEPETGRRCPVEFGLRVSRCGQGELQVVAELAFPIAKDCSRRLDADGGPLPPELAEFLWTRSAPRP